MDFDRWNEQFGGEEAIREIESVRKNNTGFTEVPDGRYKTRLEKLELGESKMGKPLVKAQFRITEGEHKKQCLFLNQVFTRGFPQHKALEFLRSLAIFEDDEVDFNGDFRDFSNLLLDMAEEAEKNHLVFVLNKDMDGEYQRLTVVEVM